MRDFYLKPSPDLILDMDELQKLPKPPFGIAESKDPWRRTAISDFWVFGGHVSIRYAYESFFSINSVQLDSMYVRTSIIFCLQILLAMLYNNNQSKQISSAKLQFGITCALRAWELKIGKMDILCNNKS